MPRKPIPNSARSAIPVRSGSCTQIPSVAVPLAKNSGNIRLYSWSIERKPHSVSNGYTTNENLASEAGSVSVESPKSTAMTSCCAESE